MKFLMSERARVHTLHCIVYVDDQGKCNIHLVLVAGRNSIHVDDACGAEHPNKRFHLHDAFRYTVYLCQVPDDVNQ